MYLLLATAVLSVLLWLWWRNPHADEPPVIAGNLPFIGCAHRLIGDSHRLWNSLKNISNECTGKGGVVYFHIGPKKLYVITDPDDCFTVANTCLDKDSISTKFSKALLGDGLLIGPAATWKRHRKALNPAFNQKVLDSFMGVFNSQARRLVNCLSVELGQRPFDQAIYLRECALETVCLTAMGIDIRENMKSNREYVKTFDYLLASAIERFMTPWMHSDFIYNFTSLKRKQYAALKVIHDLTDSVLKRKKCERNEGVSSEDLNKQGPKYKPFMDLILDLEGEFTEQEIRDEIINIMIAGHESTGTLQVYILVLIGSYPEIQAKLYAEMQHILGPGDKDVEKGDLSQLVYMEAVIRETLRFYTLSPYISRHIDTTLKLKNCTLRPGYECILLVEGVNHHPLWGPDVNEFKPERWLSPSTLPDNPNIFMSFGSGRRNCIGKVFAMMTIKTNLVHILRSFRVTGDHTKMKLNFDVLLKPESGHTISIEKRV